ncbi:hypothetical protein [Roseateles sp.]|uniref:hypothetical protein n=1 Tax=Roseateles sp. TaxID=1971397 RepID=UPI0039EB0AE0
MAFSRHLLMLVPLACAACAPFPHLVTLTPDITGTLTRDGQPVAGQEIQLARGPDADPCSIRLESARTGADGGFKLERKTQLVLIYAPLVAPLSVSPFNVCATTPDKTLLLFRGLVPLYNARPLELACTLKELQPALPQPAYQRLPQAEPPCKVGQVRLE